MLTHEFPLMLHTHVTTSYLHSPVLCLEHCLLPRVRQDFGDKGGDLVMSQWLSGDLRGQLHIIVEARKSGDLYGNLDIMNILSCTMPWWSKQRG